MSILKREEEIQNKTKLLLNQAIVVVWISADFLFFTSTKFANEFRLKLYKILQRIKTTNKLFKENFQRYKLIGGYFGVLKILLTPFITDHSPILLYEFLFLCNIRLSKWISLWGKTALYYALNKNIEIFF